ncbi:Protein translocase subunit SecE [Kordia antarctica]|uniref:Protein translocase subunit SecE n=1 Tax=Kordia antarctica TaxID=1218801 RepID=A0A7L4ZQ52_9FLAO|nr:preprotein translocase subunit SecE [Kordia antarctica]QHI38752.1 Protein translocase subunit SecE [Kordia antarctica]
MAGIVNYVKESFEELRTNVTWTAWPEAQRLTIVVAIFSIIFSLVIWGVDSAFAKALGFVYELVLGK